MKRLTPLDLIKDLAAEHDQEDSFETDFVIMSGELGKMLPAVVDLLGGEA